MKTSEICQAAGQQVMDALNDLVAPTAPTAVMGHNIDDGSYEFMLGPIFLPHDSVSLKPPTETRNMFVNVRLDHMPLDEDQQIRWMVKRGDDYTEDVMPSQAIVVDSFKVDPDTGLIYVFYHNSRA